MIYLASPYSHKSPFVREERYIAAKAALTFLLKKEMWAYSPIVHCHELAKVSDLPKDASFWFDYSMYMLRKSDQFVILAVPGWRESVGVRQELFEARHLNLLCSQILPVDNDLLTFDLNVLVP